MPALDATKAKLASGARMLPDQLKSLQQLAATAKGLKETIVSNTEELNKLKEEDVELSLFVLTGQGELIGDIPKEVK